MKKIILLLFSLVVFIFFSFTIFKAERNSKLDVHLNSDSYFEGIRIIHKKNGHSEWVLTAQRADISKNGDTAKLNNIEMKMGKKGITVYADRGFYNFNSKDIFIDGKVKALNEKHEINTGDVTIESKTGLMRTDSIVTITGKRINLTGKGLEVDNKEQKVRVLKDVYATFNN